MDVVLSAILLTLLVGLATATLLKFRSGRKARATEKDRDEKERKVQDACTQALTIVDLTTGDGSRAEVLSTSTLTLINHRIQSLDKQVAQLVRRSTDARLTEALSEMRHVAVSLGAALESERTIRIQASDASENQRLSSHRRIAARSAELDMASRGVGWILTDAD